MLKKLLQLLLSALIVTGLYFFCDWQTQGFRPYLILSNLPNDPRWETAPLASEEQAHMKDLLRQSFTLIGKGGWCFAFLGEDQKTVLKFYRHDHLEPLSVLTDFSWNKLFHHCPILTQGARYFQEFNFASCMLLHHRLKNRAGLLYVHINKTEGQYGAVTLIDNIGIHHQIDLDHTEFVVQNKAEFLIDYINHAVEDQHIDEAKRVIDDYLVCLTELCKQGVRDLDRKLKDNYGVIDGRVVTLDISSFIEDLSLQQPAPAKKEIILKSHAFAKWLSKKHPDLFVYCDDMLTELLAHDSP